MCGVRCARLMPIFGGSMSQRQNGTDAYSRALEDPVFLAAVATAYDGRYAVLDVLWWLSNPGESAPSGAVAPSTTVAELRRRIYSAAGDDVGDAGATHELRRLEQDLATEHRAAQHAVAAADTPRTSALVGGPDLEELVTSTHRNGVHAREELEHLEEEPPQVTPHPTVRTRILVASGIVAALIVGLVVGAQLARPEADTSASGTPLVASSADAVLESFPVTAAEIFDRVQEPADVPTQKLPATFVQESLRVLMPARDSGSPTGIFAARSSSHMICILVLLSDDEYASNCTVESEFPTTGLRIYWVEELEFQVDDQQTIAETVDMSAIWKADGDFNVSGTGRGLQG